MRQIKLPTLNFQIITMILLILFSCIATVSAAEITVGSAGEDYPNISAALATANNGDTIIVSAGTYNENIVVDREVTIRSQSDAINTIINSLSGSDAINITSSNVTINGFTVTGASASSMVGIYLGSTSNCTVSNNMVTGNYYGIVLDSSSNNSLIGNNVNNNTDYGLVLDSSNSNNLTGNNVSNNDNYGLVLSSSNNNNLTGNNAINNDNYGISVSHSSGNNLTGNNASGDYYGIQFYYSDSNELTGNNASYNDCHGIYLSSSSNNEITSNNVNNNTNQGIYLTSSNGNNLTNNNASENGCGIRFSSSDNNNLTNNNANDNDFGIRFFSSSGNYMTGNMMSSNTYNFNINVFNSDMTNLLHDIDDSNNVDGKPIYYWTNHKDEEVPYDAGIVYVVNSTNITVKDIEVTNEYSGIIFAYTTNSTIENTTTSQCDDGIYLYHSNVNELINNSASYNDYGIYLSSSSNNNLTNNHAHENERGISFSSSSDNELTSNNASENNYGIYLYHSNNNELTRNNLNSNDDSGTYLASSSNNNLTSNNASDNDCGIYFSSSSSNNLTSNNVNNNTNQGIYLRYSDNNNLISNNASDNNYGIYLSSSNNDNLRNNIMLSNLYNFHVSSSNQDDYLHDIDDSNTVDSKPVYYWTNRADDEVPSSAGVVYVINSTNVTVKDIQVTKEYNGIAFAYTTNSTIENITSSECNYGIYLRHSDYNYLTRIVANSNSNDGIFLDYSDHNDLTSNNANANNDDGIGLSFSHNNNLTSNNAINNDDDGIYLWASDHNNLEHNSADSNNGCGIYLRSSDYGNMTSNNLINNNEKDLYAYNSPGFMVDHLTFTDSLAQVSFVTDSSSTSIIGSDTNDASFSGKTNINGYATIDRSGDLNVTFFYNDSGMSSSGESTVALYRLDGSIWSEVPNISLNIDGDNLSVPISEFGTFGLFKDIELSSSSSSQSDGSSVYSRTISQGRITKLTQDASGEITKDSTAISSNGMAKLEFSKGTVALDSNGNPVSKVIITTPASLPSDTPKEILNSGLYYEFGPSGTTFNRDVLISIDFRPEDFEDIIPVIYTYTSEAGWVALETTVDWKNGKVMAYTNHFSLYAVFNTDVDDAGISTLETAEIPTKTSSVEYAEISIEDNDASSFVYWALGIALVLSLGIVGLKKYKGEGGL